MSMFGPKGAIFNASADGIIPIRHGTVFITKGSAAALTLADPIAGRDDGCVLIIMSTTAAAHTVDNSAGSGFFSSGGSSKDIGTYGAAIGNVLMITAYQGKWYIVTSTNVTLG